MRRAALAFGAVFGFVLSWSQTTQPDRIQDMLLLKDPYLYLMLGSAVAVGTIGTRLLRRRGFRALVTGERISWETLRPQRRHVVGSAIFGAGWAVSDACPGPIAAQLGQGFAWALFTAVGVIIGVELHLRRQERTATASAPSARTAPARR